MDKIFLLGIMNKLLVRQVKSYLDALGADSIKEAYDPESLLRSARSLNPALIVMDPGSFGAAGLQAAKVLVRERIAPVVFVLSPSCSFSSAIEELIYKEDYASTYLVTPLLDTNFRIAINTTLANFQKLGELKKKVDGLAEELGNRKILNKAKRLIMEDRNFSENEAHHYLQRLSMNRSEPLVLIAKKVIGYYKKQLESGK